MQATDEKEIPYQIIVESSMLKGSGLGRYRGLKQIALLHSLAVEKLKLQKGT